jgi:hypothetical protein
MGCVNNFTARIYDWAHRFVQTLRDIVSEQTKHNVCSKKISEVVFGNFSHLLAANNTYSYFCYYVCLMRII